MYCIALRLLATFPLLASASSPSGCRGRLPLALPLRLYPLLPELRRMLQFVFSAFNSDRLESVLSVSVASPDASNEPLLLFLFLLVDELTDGRDLLAVLAAPLRIQLRAAAFAAARDGVDARPALVAQVRLMVGLQSSISVGAAGRMSAFTYDVSDSNKLLLLRVPAPNRPHTTDHLAVLAVEVEHHLLPSL